MASPRKPPPKSKKPAKAPAKAPAKKAAAPSKTRPQPKKDPLRQMQRPAKVKPARTLVPLSGAGNEKTPVESPLDFEDTRIRQWPVRGAPGVRTVFGWDVELVADALRKHALGNPISTGSLLDDLKVNPIIQHCNSVRQEAFRTLPRCVVPGKGGGERMDAKRFADFIKEVLPDILPDGTVDDIWLHHEYMGESLCGIDWEERTDGKDRWWLPFLKPWHPSQMYHYYRPDKGERTADGQVLAAITRDRGSVIVEPGMGRWLYIARGTLAPWMNGLIRALGEPYLGDTYTLRDNLALQERYGQGVSKLFHPVSWNDSQIADSVQTVYAAGKGGVIPCPQNKPGERLVDLELLTPSAAGAALFDLTERRLLRRFLISLLGQDMTTVGQTGGFAQASIHSQVLWHKRERDAATFGDARLEITVGDDGKPTRRWVPYSGPIRMQLMRWIAWFNIGSFDAAPYVYWDAIPPEDAQQKAKDEAQVGQQRAAAFAQMITALQALQGQGQSGGTGPNGEPLPAAPSPTKLYNPTPKDIQFLAKQFGIDLYAPLEEEKK